jgi:hypothetical protein
MSGSPRRARGPRSRARVRASGLLGALLLVVPAGCSDAGESSDAPAGDAGDTGGTGDTAASPSAGDGTAAAAPAGDYLPVPDTLSLTAPGTVLDHGQSATVAWELPGGEVAVADLQVERVRKVRRSVFAGWLQEGAVESAVPYFVDVVVENRGATDLGGEQVPLYLLDDSGTLGPPATFGGRFEPCSSRPLPRRFGRGDEAERCLVYLAPRRTAVEAMGFVPVDDFDAITWQGKVVDRTADRGQQERQEKKQERR